MDELRARRTGELAAGDPNQVAGAGSGGRLIPVWHKVGADDVARYSPSLANLVALQNRDGVELVAERIRAAMRPAGSALLFALAELTELGESLDWHPPVVTHEPALTLDLRTGFDGRGPEVPCCALAKERKISQLTPPGDVLDWHAASSTPRLMSLPRPTGSGCSRPPSATEQAPRKGSDHARRGGRANTEREIPVHQPNPSRPTTMTRSASAADGGAIAAELRDWHEEATRPRLRWS